ncbi:MAG: DUF6089 family protein [Bacteroidia bacterium]|nr:DUF6089 family protein [Bacteroidia bacterium]
MKAIKRFAILTLALVSATSMWAQYRYGYFKAGISTGPTNYLGDLDDDLTFKFTKGGFGADISYRMNPYMTWRLNFNYGWARAADSVSSNEARNRRNLHFRTPIMEISNQIVLDFIPSDRSFAYRPAYTPYMFGGIGIFSFNPQAQLNGQWYDLQPMGTEGQFLPNPTGNNPAPYKLTQICFPMGVGARFALSRHIDLEIETGFRKTFTDYLDDVSGLYPDLDALRAQNPVAAILSDRIDRSQFPQGAAVVNGIRGDRTQSDWYIYTCARLTYIIDWVRCPTFR